MESNTEKKENTELATARLEVTKTMYALTRIFGQERAKGYVKNFLLEDSEEALNYLINESNG